MSRNGSGTYSLPAGQPVVTGTVIDSTIFNAFTADIAAAMTASIAKDGQTTPTANLPMGTFKHTGVADATVRTQYASAGQVQDGSLRYIGAIAGVDTITGTAIPSGLAYTTGQDFIFLPAGSNTGAATINLNALGAKNIVKGSTGAALAAGDLVLNVPARIAYNGTSFYLQNPATNAAGAFLADTGAVGTPSYSFVVDTDTGMYRSAANQLAFAAGGTNYLIITTNAIAAQGASTQFHSQDGTAAAPGFTFGNDPDIGFYRVAANRIGASVNGAQQLDITVSSVEVLVGQLLAPAGTVGTPGLAFGVDPDTGMYRVAANQLGFSVGGVEHLELQSGFVIIRGAGTQILNQDGTNALPSFTFGSDNDTGAYRAGANAFGFAGGGLAGPYVAPSGATNAGIFLRDGLAATPNLTFDNDPDTGMYRIGANILGFSVGGSEFLRLDNAATGNATLAANQLLMNNGTFSLPAFSFTSDPDTGIYRISANSLGFAEGGVGFPIGYRNIPVSATTTTLVIGDVGKCVPITAAINIPISVFAAGDAVSIYNDTAGALNITISAGTLRLSGTATTGTRSLAQRGTATIWFRTGGATPEVVCSGNVT